MVAQSLNFGSVSVCFFYVAILQFPDRLCKTEANKIFMRQSDLLPLPNGAAATIYESLVNSLKEKDIPMENVIGFCADSCNVMFGVNHSVAQMLVRDYPWIVAVKCSAHLIHLCSSYSVRLNEASKIC